MQKISRADTRYMRRALELARQGAGRVHPNPLVGAVLVKAGRVIGEGAHLKFGGPHAEVNAVRSAGSGTAGSTLYVSLEPCSHTGKTPPCTKFLAKNRIARVIAAVKDPDPRVNGRGLAQLRRAGVDVHSGLLEREAVELNRDWIFWLKTGRPYVAAKIAQSRDGFIAGQRSRWITGPAARRYGHRLRAASDAVLVGVGTVLADDPLLTARGVGAARQPLRVVLDTKRRTPRGARLFSDRSPVLIAAGPSRKGRVDVKKLLERLGRQGIVRVLVEGGAETWDEFYRRGLVNECYRFVSPKKLGAGTRVPSSARRRRVVERIRLGKDMLFREEVR